MVQVLHPIIVVLAIIVSIVRILTPTELAPPVSRVAQHIATLHDVKPRLVYRQYDVVELAPMK